jgi:ABC-type polysaccharide/polyol phosphate export permease
MNALAQILARILVALFFIGMTGSFFVVIFTVIRDLRQVLSTKDESGGTDL